MSPSNPKTALITGVTGQDGAYLAEFLLTKNYVVHGIKRRSSSFNTGRIDHLYHAAIGLGLQDRLYLGNLDAKRDWRHARDRRCDVWRLSAATNLRVHAALVLRDANQSSIRIEVDKERYQDFLDACERLLRDSIRRGHVHKHVMTNAKFAAETVQTITRAHARMQCRRGRQELL